MIKVTEIQTTDLEMNSYKVSLFADTKSEVTPDAEIIGLPEGATIEMGSSVLTAGAEIAFMKSNGQWQWV